MSMALDCRTVLTANHDARNLERAEVLRRRPASASKSFPSIETNMTNWLTIARAATFTVPGFKFADGGNLDLRLHYRTLGCWLRSQQCHPDAAWNDWQWRAIPAADQC
jgi:hypothetical protein